MERKKIKQVLKAIGLICIILVAGYFILNSVIQKKIRQQFANLSPALLLKFSNVHVNIFSSSVSFDSLDINFTPYNTLQQNTHHLYFPQASLKGISFLKFLLSKKLGANHLFLDEGNIQLDSFLLGKKDSAQSGVLRQIKWPLKKIFIRDVELKNARVFQHSDKDDQLLARGNIALGEVSIEKPGENPAFKAIDISLSDLNYKLPDYEIRIRQLFVNSLSKILELHSLHLISQGQKQNEITISSIRMTGFDVMRLLNEQILTTKKIIINESKIAVVQNEKFKLPPLPFELKKIHAGNVQCKMASVSYKDKINECSFKAAAELQDVDVDPSPDIHKFHAGSVLGNLSSVHYSGNNYHNVEIKNIEINSKKQLIQMEDINIIPRFGKYEFERKLGHQADRIQANISKIEIIKPDIDKLFNQKLFAEKIKIGESNAHVFRDRRLPRPQKNIPLPGDYIKTIPVDVRVKTCELATSAVAYEEYPKSGYGITGILKIEKIKVNLSPLINHPTPSDPAYITMNVEGSIMGSGTAHATILMPLQKNKAYRVTGAIEQLELTKLNSSSENLGKIRIKSGFLDFLSFDFTMDQQHSTGKIIGAYHHLIIQQLKKHTEEKNVADFASFALRHAIIPLNKDKSLPERKRTGLVNYKRDPSRMVSHYFLQSLLMGVKKSFTLGFLLPK